MSALRELDLRAVRAVAETASASDTILRAAVGAAFWRWFHNNKARRLKVRVWLFRPSVRVEALRELFVLLFGADPTGAL